VGGKGKYSVLPILGVIRMLFAGVEELKQLPSPFLIENFSVCSNNNLGIEGKAGLRSGEEFGLPGE